MVGLRRLSPEPRRRSGELSALAGGLLANSFIEEHAEALLGDFTAEYLHGGLLIPRWRFGFIHAALLRRATMAGLTEVTAGFVRLPAVRFVRELCLSLDHHSRERDADWAPVIDAVAEARGDVVEHLELWHGSSCGSGTTLDGLASLLSGTGFGALRHLGLLNYGCSLELLGALSTAKLLPRLTSLDLSGGRMTHLSARLFVERASDFTHLTRLDLSFNTLGESDAAAITQALPNTRVNTADQVPRSESYSRTIRDALSRGR